MAGSYIGTTHGHAHRRRRHTGTATRGPGQTVLVGTRPIRGRIRATPDVNRVDLKRWGSTATSGPFAQQRA